jgi:hypothetical protein
MFQNNTDGNSYFVTISLFQLVTAILYYCHQPQQIAGLLISINKQQQMWHDCGKRRRTQRSLTHQKEERKIRRWLSSGL